METSGITREATSQNHRYRISKLRHAPLCSKRRVSDCVTMLPLLLHMLLKDSRSTLRVSPMVSLSLTVSAMLPNMSDDSSSPICLLCTHISVTYTPFLFSYAFPQRTGIVCMHFTDHTTARFTKVLCIRMRNYRKSVKAYRIYVNNHL